MFLFFTDCHWPHLVFQTRRCRAKEKPAAESNVVGASSFIPIVARESAGSGASMRVRRRILLCMVMMIWFSGIGWTSGNSPFKSRSAVAEDAAQIAEMLRASRDRLLRLPSGFVMEYQITVDQNDRRPYFIWSRSVQGRLGIKWPQLYTRVEGKMFRTVTTAGIRRRMAKPATREADYNFETKTGAAREGHMLVQVTDYRHAFSTDSCFPLCWQYFVETDQHYYPGDTLESDFWLPNALQQEPFKVVGSETIRGIPCVLLVNGKVDKLWIAPNHSHVVMRRKRFSPDNGKLLHHLEASALRQVSPNVWFPMQQTLEVFHQKSGSRLAKLDLTITRFTTANIDESQLRIHVPDDIVRVEDHIVDRVYERPTSEDPYKEAVEKAEVTMRTLPPAGQTRLVVLGAASILLFLAVVGLYLFYRLRVVA